MLRRGEAFRNRAKRLLAEKKKLSAAWLQAASPITAEIMAKAGFDILMVDGTWARGHNEPYKPDAGHFPL